MDHVSKMTSGILNLFLPEQMEQLIIDLHNLTELWEITEEEEKQLQGLVNEELDRLRLIRSAYMLSKLACNHAQALRKINDRFPSYWKICDDVNGGSQKP